MHLPGNVNKWKWNKWNYCDWPVQAYTFPFAFSPQSLINEIRFSALAWGIIIKLRYKDSHMRDIAKPKSLKWMWENLQRGKTWGTNTLGKGKKKERERKKQKSPRILFVSIVAGITYKTVGYDHKVINAMHKHEWLYSLRHNPYKDSPQKSKSVIRHELFGHFVTFCMVDANLAATCSEVLPCTYNTACLPVAYHLDRVCVYKPPLDSEIHNEIHMSHL